MLKLCIEYDEVGKGMMPSALRWYRSIYNECIKHIPNDRKIDIVLVLTDDLSIKTLNSNYRKQNKVTDVLSFYYGDDCEKGYGEVFISVQTAIEQASRYKHSLAKEIARLIIHGVLHIYGYDHMKAKDRVIMRELETKIFKNVLSHPNV